MLRISGFNISAIVVFCCYGGLKLKEARENLQSWSEGRCIG